MMSVLCRRILRVEIKKRVGNTMIHDVEYSEKQEKNNSQSFRKITFGHGIGGEKLASILP